MYKRSINYSVKQWARKQQHRKAGTNWVRKVG